MRSFPVTVLLAAGFGSGQPFLLHIDHEVVPCNCFYWPLALALYATLNEPLEGVYSFNVLLDPNDSVFDPHPGFQHRFVGLYSSFSDTSHFSSIKVSFYGPSIITMEGELR